MGKFYLKKSDLMQTMTNENFLLQEDDMTSNGRWLIKNEYLGFRKGFNFESKTLKDYMGTNKTMAEMFKTCFEYIPDDEYKIQNNDLTTLKVVLIADSEKCEKYIPRMMYKEDYERIMKISPDIKFHVDAMAKYTPIRIVLNNEVIGIIQEQC